jgi:hypothetical protein
MVYHFSFQGTISGEQFASPPSALASVVAGDLLLLNFDVDSGTGQVENIDADFVTNGIDLSFPGVDTSWTSYNGAPPYEYRWDFNLPGMSPYTMLFWFRTTTPGVVTGGVPATIEASQFNYLQDFDIYYNTGDGGPPAINASLQNTTPEPSSVVLMALGILGIAGSRRWRRVRVGASRFRHRP